MFQRKIVELFEELLNVFGLADDILIAGSNADGTDYLKLNKDKCLIISTYVPFCGDIIPR